MFYSPLPDFLKEVLTICVPEVGYRPLYQFYPVKRIYSLIEVRDMDIVFFSCNKSREHFVKYGNELLFLSSYRPLVRVDSGIEIMRLPRNIEYSSR